MIKARFSLILGALALGVTACSNGVVPPIPRPPVVSVLPTTTTFPDYSTDSLPSVQGTTTTAPVRITGGTSTINGKVSIQGATTAGIVVHIDRFVGTASAGADTVSAADGGFSFRGILGGRYRIRAYRPPDATLTNPVVVFVNQGQTQTENLSLTKFSAGNTVAANIAPSPPNLGDVANVVVQVTTQGVDNTGTAKSIGQPGVAITLVSAGGRTIVTANPMVTSSAGTAQWTIRCDSLAAQGLTAVLPDGTQTPLNLPGCQVPPTTTTTAAPPPGVVIAGQ